jgi:hypothetical protein
VLHADLCLAVQFPDRGDEVIDGRLRVTEIPRREDNDISGLADRDGASSLETSIPTAFMRQYPLYGITTVEAGFSHCRFNLLGMSLERAVQPA